MENVVIIVPAGNYLIKSNLYLGDVSIIGMSRDMELDDIIKLATLRALLQYRIIEVLLTIKLNPAILAAVGVNWH